MYQHQSLRKNVREFCRRFGIPYRSAEYYKIKYGFLQSGGMLGDDVNEFPEDSDPVFQFHQLLDENGHFVEFHHIFPDYEFDSEAELAATLADEGAAAEGAAAEGAADVSAEVLPPYFEWTEEMTGKMQENLQTAIQATPGELIEARTEADAAVAATTAPHKSYVIPLKPGVTSTSFMVGLIADIIHDFLKDEERARALKTTYKTISDILALFEGIFPKLSDPQIANAPYEACQLIRRFCDTYANDLVSKAKGGYLVNQQLGSSSLQYIAERLLGHIGGISLHSKKFDDAAGPDTWTHLFQPLSSSLSSLVNKVRGGEVPKSQDCSNPFIFDKTNLARPLLPFEYQCFMLLGQFMPPAGSPRKIGLVVDATKQRESTITNVMIMQNIVSSGDSDPSNIEIIQTIANDLDMAKKDALFSLQSGINNIHSSSNEISCIFDIQDSGSSVLKWKLHKLPNVLQILFNYDSFSLLTGDLSSNITTGIPSPLQDILNKIIGDMYVERQKDSIEDWKHAEMGTTMKCSAHTTYDTGFFKELISSSDIKKRISEKNPEANQTLFTICDSLLYVDPTCSSVYIEYMNGIQRIRKLRTDLHRLLAQIKKYYTNHCSYTWHDISTEFKSWVEKTFKEMKDGYAIWFDSEKLGNFLDYHCPSGDRKIHLEMAHLQELYVNDDENADVCTFEELASIWYLFIIYLETKGMTLELFNTLIPSHVIITDLDIPLVDLSIYQKNISKYLVNQDKHGPSVSNISKCISSLKVLESFFNNPSDSARLSADFIGPLRQSDVSAKYTMYICRSPHRRLYRISFTQEINSDVTYGYNIEGQKGAIQVTENINRKLVKLLSDLLFWGIITNIKKTEDIHDQRVCLFLQNTQSMSRDTAKGRARGATKGRARGAAKGRARGAAKGKQFCIPTVMPFTDYPYYVVCALLSKTLCDLSIGCWVAGNNNETGQVHFLLTFDRTAAQVSSLLGNMDKHTLLQSKNTLYYMDFLTNGKDPRFIHSNEGTPEEQPAEIQLCNTLYPA